MNQQRIEIARNILVEEIDKHDAECQRRPCNERVNLAAWIAHCLGVRPEHACNFTRLLTQYHVDCKCHPRDGQAKGGGQ